MLNVIMLSVVMMSVVMLNVVAPFEQACLITRTITDFKLVDIQVRHAKRKNNLKIMVRGFVNSVPSAKTYSRK
jgi:hypothetical protein